MSQGFIKEEDQEPGITGLEFYYDAFAELSTARAIGLAAGPIPFTAIVEYSRLYEIEDFDEFAYIIRWMDRVYLELNSSTVPKGEGTKGGNRDADKKNSN